MRARVSIIVPVYNAEKYIKHCLESLALQSFRDIEILVINDGSTDRSQKICESFVALDERFILISTKNHGVSHARNLGIQRAVGEYITFVDADDWIEKNAIMNMIQISSKYSVDCVRMSYYKSSNVVHKSTLDSRLYKKNEFSLLAEKFMDGSEPCYSCLLLIKSQLIKSISLFDETIKYLEDKCAYARLLNLLNTIYISNIATYHYRDNNSSATRSIHNYELNIQQTIYAQEYLQDQLDKSELFESARQKAVFASFKIISGYLYAIYRDMDKKSVISIVNKLSSSPEFKKTFSQLRPTAITDTSPTVLYVYFLNYCVTRQRIRLVLFVFSVRAIFESLVKKRRVIHAN